MEEKLKQALNSVANEEWHISKSTPALYSFVRGPYHILIEARNPKQVSTWTITLTNRKDGQEVKLGPIKTENLTSELSHFIEQQIHQNNL